MIQRAVTEETIDLGRAFVTRIILTLCIGKKPAVVAIHQIPPYAEIASPNLSTIVSLEP